MKPNQQSSLDTWIDWLLALHAQEIDLGIERVKSVAQSMGVIPFSIPVISVAGTNGKGSSASMLTSIYQAAGYRVGLYTSPHILRFNERIRLNERLATDAEITQAFTEIEAARGEIKLTYFEFSTLAALVLFAKAELDVIVLEVGLGGRLDAVNMVDADASLITAIDVDHADWLGNDRNQIAVEKAGIMRANCPSVCSDADIPQTLIDYAAQNQVPLKCLKNDYFYRKNHQAWWFLDEKKAVLHELPLPNLEGDFQVQNAAGVIALIDAMQVRLPVTSEAMATGLSQVTHPGRLQQLSVGNQVWLVDVAHNPQSAEVLAEYLSTSDFEGEAVFSVLADKDAAPMIRRMQPFISRWHLADLQVPRAMSVNEMESLLLEVGVASHNIVKYAQLSDAVMALAESDKKAEAGNKKANKASVLVWGSFFTVAQMLAAGMEHHLIEGLSEHA